MLSSLWSPRTVCSNCWLVRWSLAGWNVLLIRCSPSPRCSQVSWTIAQYSNSPLPTLSLICQSFSAAQHRIPENKLCFSSRLFSFVWVNLYSCISCICFPSTFPQIIGEKESRHFSGSNKVTWQGFVNNMCFWALSPSCCVCFLKSLCLCFSVGSPR